MTASPGIDRASLRRRALGLSLALWAFIMGMLWYAGTINTVEEVPPLQLWLVRLAWMASGFALGWMIFRILEWSVENTSIGPITALVALVCIFGAFHTVVNSLLYFELAGATATPLQHVVAIVYWLHFQLAWGVLILTLVMGAQAKAEREGRLMAQREAQSAQLDALTFQVHPHFLFNTLGAVSSLVGEEQFEKGEAMVRKLAIFLRRGLRREANEDVTLEQEFADLAVYIDIERIRFEGRFEFRAHLDAGVRNALVSGFLLQPLVENAIKYAVAPSKRFVTLDLSACRAGENVEISLVDDGPGSSNSHGLGTGEANVRERLRARFGDNVSFDAGPRSAGGYAVRLSFPYQRAAMEADGEEMPA